MAIDLSRPGVWGSKALEGGGQGIVPGNPVLEIEVAQERTIPVPVRLDLEALAPVDPAYPAGDVRPPLGRFSPAALSCSTGTMFGSPSGDGLPSHPSRKRKACRGPPGAMPLDWLALQML